MKKSKNIFKKLEKILEHIDIELNYDIDYRLRWLLDRDFRTQHFEKNPECFITVRIGDNNVPFFPICNRTALQDRKFVRMGLTAAKMLLRRNDINKQSVYDAISKLSSVLGKKALP